MIINRYMKMINLAIKIIKKELIIVLKKIYNLTIWYIKKNLIMINMIIKWMFKIFRHIIDDNMCWFNIINFVNYFISILLLVFKLF